MIEDNRTEKILAILLLNSIKGSPTGEKAHQLSLAGFTNIEIADLLETTTGHVAQSLYERKKKGKAKKKKG
jgi:hypothetical protein